YVTLNLSGVNSVIANFGITIFEGMDLGLDNGTEDPYYSHHAVWNKPSDLLDFTADNPFGTTGLTYLTHSANVDAVNGLTFFAEAGKIYSIFLGGSGGRSWMLDRDEYVLTITSSP